MKNLVLKLLAFQKKVQAIPKDAVNPFFKSKYADINTYIEMVKPILSKHGLVLLQPLTSKEGKAYLDTIIIDSESGEMIEQAVNLPENTDPQKMGAVITYFRRYALQSLLFLETEDDDGNSVSVPQNTVKQQQPSLQQPTTDMPFGNEEICPKCNAPMAISKTKGTKYCSAKCWLA